jgi:hypothetical protein
MDNNIYNLAGLSDDDSLGKIIPGYSAMPQTGKQAIKQNMVNLAVKATSQVSPNKNKVRYLAQIKKVPTEIQTSADAGNLKWDVHDFYCRKLVTLGGGADIQIVDTANIIKTGVSNFKEDQLATGYSMLITHLRIMVGHDATGTITDPADVQYYNFTSFPACVLNNELSMRIGSDQIFERRPLCSFLPTGPDSTVNVIDTAASTYDLGLDHAYWSAGQKIVIQLHTCSTPVPAGNWFFHFEVLGPGLSPN